MKINDYLLTICFCLLIIFNGHIVFASEESLVTKELSDARKDHYMNYFTINKRIGQKSKKYGFNNYDVNEERMIALSSEDDTEKIILIYSDNGERIAGYTFEYYGSYYVEWYDSDHLQIYLLRNNVILIMNLKGEIIDALSLEYSTGQSRYMNETIRGRIKVIDNDKYVSKKSMWPFCLLQPNYSKLILQDEAGNETLIYDASISTTAGILLLVFWVLCIIYPFTRYKKNDTSLQFHNKSHYRKQ